MKKSKEQVLAEKMVEAVADIRFQDSLLALEINRQPPQIQRRIMKLFLTLVKFWGVDWKYENYHLKDNDTVEISETIDTILLQDGAGKSLIDGYQPPVVEWYSTKEQAVNLNEYNYQRD
jgi:hypothetical protein